jgi:hypothetical protein
MKSRITIEVDFDNNNQPILQILQTSSDDVRDKLLSAFCQQFGGSSWCNIKWVFTPPVNIMDDTHLFNRIHITPIKPEDLKKQAEIMLEQSNVNEDFMKTGTLSYKSHQTAD